MFRLILVFQLKCHFGVQKKKFGHMMHTIGSPKSPASPKGVGVTRSNDGISGGGTGSGEHGSMEDRVPLHLPDPSSFKKGREAKVGTKQLGEIVVSKKYRVNNDDNDGDTIDGGGTVATEMSSLTLPKELRG